MSFWVCCNSCFLSPTADRKLAVTSCGHVICNVCYGKGSLKPTSTGKKKRMIRQGHLLDFKQGSCLICNAKCKVSPLSDKSNTEVKALFSDISVVATKHLKEISKVFTFQTGHRKRLLTYYQHKNEKQKEALVKMTHEIQQMTKEINDQSCYIAKMENFLQHKSAKLSSVPQMTHSSHTTHGQKSVFQIPRSSPMSLSRHSSVTDVTDNMELEERSLFRNPNSVPQVSLMGASQNGQIEMFPHRPTSQDTLTNHSILSANVSRSQGLTRTPDFYYSQSSGWASPVFRPPSSFRRSMSSLVCPPP